MQVRLIGEPGVKTRRGRAASRARQPGRERASPLILKNLGGQLLCFGVAESLALPFVVQVFELNRWRWASCAGQPATGLRHPTRTTGQVPPPDRLAACPPLAPRRLRPPAFRLRSYAVFARHVVAIPDREALAGLTLLFDSTFIPHFPPPQFTVGPVPLPAERSVQSLMGHRNQDGFTNCSSSFAAQKNALSRSERRHYLNCYRRLPVLLSPHRTWAR